MTVSPRTQAAVGIGAVLAALVAPIPDAPQLSDTTGIPARAIEAYVRAGRLSGAPWQLIAAIGEVESNHCRYGGRTLLADGRPDRPIFGVPLDGSTPGTAVIWDSDGGALDGLSGIDRAVGCMQFLPSTWLAWAAESDGDGDGVTDPQDLDDAALATGHKLASHGNLADPAIARRAVLAYNPSSAYADDVLARYARFNGAAPGLPETGPAAGLWAKLQRFATQVGLGELWERVAARLGLATPPAAGEVTGQQVNVEGIVVDASIAEGLRGLLAAARADGLHLSGWGFRDQATSIELRNRNGCPDLHSPADTCRVPTAPVGASMHEQGGGLAVDFYEVGPGGEPLPLSDRADRWLRANAPRFGLYPLPPELGENWHYSPNGR